MRQITVFNFVPEVEREIEKSFEMEEVEETEALIPSKLLSDSKLKFFINMVFVSEIPLRKGKVEMKEVKVGEIIPSFIAPILGWLSFNSLKQIFYKYFYPFRNCIGKEDT